MNHLKYCPKCGNQTLLWDGEKKWSCSNCNYVMFHNCAAAVAVIVKCGDEIMFTRRNQEPKKGKLDLAGGFTDPHESAETTCERELYEELNIRIDKNKLKIISTLPNVYHYKEIDYNTLDIFFEYEVENKFDVKLDESEVSEIVWIPKEQINLEDIAFDSQRKFFAEYLGF